MKRRPIKIFSTLMFSLLLINLMVFPVAAAVVPIDHFNTTSSVTVTDDSGSPAWGFSYGADWLARTGGLAVDQRDLLVTRTSTGGAASLTIGTGTGYLDFATTGGGTGTFTLTLDEIETEDQTNATTIAHLPGGNLVDTNNFGLHIEVSLASKPTVLHIQAFSGASNCSEASINIPGGIASGSHVDFFAYFFQFTTCSGSGAANYTNITALRMTLTAATVDTHVRIHLVESTTKSDWGDLPLIYGEPRHSSSIGTRLGGDVDTEEHHQASINADGDDINQSDDEDGVLRTAGWNWVIGPASGSTGGKVDIDVQYCPATCTLAGWVDFNRNGTFDEGERIINQSVVTSDSTYWFAIPSSVGGIEVTIGGSFAARFRLFIGTIADPDPDTDGQGGGTGSYAIGGEVEDYYWAFTPTAVELSSFAGHSAAGSSNWVWVLALISLLITASTVFWRKSIFVKA